MAKRSFRSSSSTARVSWKFPWTSANFTGLGIGIGVIVLGFVLLYVGNLTSWDNPLALDIAPVVLVLGYCVVVPWAIMRGSKNSAE